MNRISRKQDTAIGALLSQPTISAAAESVGIGEATLRRWLKTPDFLAAYGTAWREAVSQAVGQLQAACSVAVVALIDISQYVNSPASARGGLRGQNRAGIGYEERRTRRPGGTG